MNFISGRGIDFSLNLDAGMLMPFAASAVGILSAMGFSIGFVKTVPSGSKCEKDGLFQSQGLAQNPCYGMRWLGHNESDWAALTLSVGLGLSLFQISVDLGASCTDTTWARGNCWQDFQHLGLKPLEDPAALEKD